MHNFFLLQKMQLFLQANRIRMLTIAPLTNQKILSIRQRFLWLNMKMFQKRLKMWKVIILI